MMKYIDPVQSSSSKTWSKLMIDAFEMSFQIRRNNGEINGEEPVFTSLVCCLLESACQCQIFVKVDIYLYG